MSAVSSCFALLLSMRDPSQIDSASGEDQKVLLQLVISIVLRDDLPLFKFLTGHSIDVAAICHEVTAKSPPRQLITEQELEVLTRVLTAHRVPLQQAMEQMHISISLFCAGVIKELASSIKVDRAKLMQAGAADPPQRDASSPAAAATAAAAATRLVSAAAETPSFAVDRAFIARLNSFIESLGPNGDDGARAAEIVCSNFPVALTRDAKNLWIYALASRKEFGGLDLAQRSELVASALEMTGEELYPKATSVHAAARACLSLIANAF